MNVTPKGHRHLLILMLFAIATVAAYVWFVKSTYFPGFLAWSQQHILLYYSVLVSIKIIGIIWPPISGGVFTLGSIPVLGWPLAFSADFLGSLIGSSAAYFIAKRYGLNFVKKIFDQDALDKILKIKIKPKREIESIFLLRIFGGNIVEVICYGAGLLGVSYKNYLIGTFFSHIVLVAPVFYLTKDFLGGNRVYFNLVIVLLAGFAFYKLKHRYFDYDHDKV